MHAILSNFKQISPPYRTEQQKLLEWIGKAHAFSGADVREELLRIGSGIETRGHVLSDFLHEEWEKMQVYNLHEKSTGLPLAERQSVHQKIVREQFQKAYEEEKAAPDHILHVSCTGYHSPSAAQMMVAKKEWGKKTAVTHVYHMGCYAAIPAVRIGVGFTGRRDVVHTELSSLHFHPALHTKEQLVAQSLFADGSIRYTISEEGSGLKVLAIHEEIINDSEEYMKWVFAESAFLLTLSKELPVLIAKEVKEFSRRLCERANVEFSCDLLFAIHPGGPKIVDHIKRALSLDERQLVKSREILKNYGNMSSATLPHIWELIANDDQIKKGTKVLTLAFGPGITIAGMVLEKV